MSTYVRSGLRTLFGILILLPLISPPPARGCDESYWDHGKRIVIRSGTVAGSVRSGSGPDAILVEPGAQVLSEGAYAIGIDSGNGGDSVLNEGAVSAAAVSPQASAEAGADCRPGGTDASATAIGIRTGNGGDSVLNTGTIWASATALLADSGRARSLAVGIDAGNGKDRIVNQGQLAVTASSMVQTGRRGTGLDGPTVAKAEAVGIDTGNCGNESVEVGNTSAITVAASSSIDAGAFSLTLAGHSRGVDTSLASCSEAFGIVGGNGRDTIVSSGTLSVAAQSNITQSEVSLTLLEAAGADTSSKASAFAVGIDGGSGQDQVSNQGELSVTATSTVETDRFALTGITASSERAAHFDASVTAESRAVGIAAGNASDEVLGIGNCSAISVQSSSTVNTDSYSLALADGVPFTRLGIVSDSSLTADAQASGIVGGRGQDTIANEGTLAVGASASIDSLAVELNLVDAAASKADLAALAGAVGLDSGSGNDVIRNSGALSATATAGTSSWSASFSAVDVASGEFGSSTTAGAVGISSGQGGDAIDNTGTIAASATSEALVADFSMSLFDLTPLAEDGGFSTTVEAEAAGVSSGWQEDLITSSGSITATASTEATRIGVEIGAEGLSEGLFDGEFGSLENQAGADVSLRSQAIGIDAGKGDDQITNLGSIVADASAASWGGSLSLSLPLVELPFPTPFPAFSMMDAGTRAEAEATGIQGGEGDERILNEGNLDVDAGASALNIVASIGFQGSVDDVAVAATRVDALSEAQAAASGIEGGEGNEQILNSGGITVDAVAEVLGVGANVAVQNKAEPKYLLDVQGTLADVRATAGAEASGILGEAGRDAITSSGELTVTAHSRNAGVGLSAAVITEAEKGLVADGAVVKADSRSTAQAVGIDGGDEGDAIRSSGTVSVSAEAETLSAAVALSYQGSSSKALGVQGALATVTTTSEAAAEGLAGGAGDDLLVSEGALSVQADSLAIAASVAVDLMPGKSPGLGIALANAQNLATAEATGIAGGGGNDQLTNNAAVTVEADATAVAASISVTRQGAAGSGALDPATLEAGNRGEATAKGIDGGEGDETIANSGTLSVSSSAVAPSLGVAVTTSKGISAAVTTAEASASSTGIDTGGGTHGVLNTGAIAADAQATAVGVSVSVSGEGLAASLDTVWDGGTTASADSAGIRAQGGNDRIENQAVISASSTAVAPSVDVAITGKGVSVGISTATSSASSVGIEAGAGDDLVLNSGDVTSSAYANADAISVDISGKGVAGSGNDVWAGGVEASALARGIDAGAGSNTLVNSGSVTTEATATTVSAGVSIVGQGLSASVSTATATAESVGLDPGETTPELWNSGDIASTATAIAVTVNADIAGKGLAAALDEVWAGGTQATATARGLQAGAVDNVLFNQGAVTAGSEATTPSVALAITGKGLSAAVTTSTAVADAVGIDAAEGDDTVQNAGAITVSADAEAYAISASITGKGVAVAGDAVWDGGTLATARAAGIDTAAGSDRIDNAADLLADSSATTVGVGLSVAGEGITAAVSTSTAEAKAYGIDSAEGADWVQNEGNITAEASSTAVTASVDVTGKGIAVSADAVWDGGTKSTAVAKAIDAGTGAEDDVVLSQGDLAATSDALTVAADAAITGTGLSLATSTATTAAQAYGIDGGAGNDRISSAGNITVDASATGVAVAASITGTGLSGAADAVWNGGTHTTAQATGIEAGNGDDSVSSVGDITATSEAVTVAVDAAVTGTGLSLATSTATTAAQAAGIDAGMGNDTIRSEGTLTADASSTGVAVAASITGIGLSGSTDAVWDGGTDTSATAVGIAAGEGDDIVRSSGAISAIADATTVAVDAAITAKGVSLAASASATTASAAGIGGGAGSDLIENSAGITASASSTGVGVAAGLTGLGLSGATDAVWDSGTTATASATGIDVGAGDDIILNTGSILLTADADTVAVDVALTGAGVSAAMTNTSVEARAIGIDGGEGADSISSVGEIRGSATADAVGVGVSLSGAGVSASATDVWENGISGQAVFVGIDAGSGEDTVANSGAITGSSSATTPAISVSVSGIGIGAAANTASAEARATGIDGGAGDDLIGNTGSISVTSSADSNTVIVSLTGVGASVGIDSIWDGGTTAAAAATGIAGGAGNDLLSNSAAIRASATADTAATDVTVTLAGASASLVNSTASAQATGIDGSWGDDAVQSSGAITANAFAFADTVAVSVAGVGAAFGGDQWSQNTLAAATAVGIDGGAGKDSVQNTAAINAFAAAVSDATAVTVTLAGYADSEAENVSTALAAGICGGEGDDTIENSGRITLTSSARADAGSVAVNLAGAAPAAAGTSAAADGTGICGGAGADVIENSGSIAATVSACTDSSSTNVTLLGYGDSSAQSASLASATGIRGGEGDDRIENAAIASIDLIGTATAEAGGVQVGLAGAFGGQAGTTATASVTAIDAGAGNDTVHNGAQINVTSAATTTAENTTVGIFGTAGAEANTTAISLAQGLAGAEGSDTIENTGSLNVASSATTRLDAYSFEFGGSSAGQGTLAAGSRAVGISGGSGSDTIDNYGQIHASATSTMTVEGGSDVAFGTASAGANTAAVTEAAGIDAGEGDDQVTSGHTITVDALTIMTLDSSSFSFGGAAASGQGAMSASTRAVGIAGGDGSDTLTSEAAITVSPRTSLSALSGSDVAFGSADAGTSITADTQAVGIEAGAGDDTVTNRGGIRVGYHNSDPTDAMSEIDVSGSTWSFGGTGSVTAAALATGHSVGIDGGSGDDQLTNAAGLEVNCTAYARTAGSTYTFAGTSASSGAVTAQTQAEGIAAGEGQDGIANNAVITVRARSRAESTGSSETTFGSSSAYAGAASSASAAGLDGQDGEEVIENTGTVLVFADAYAYGSTNSNVFAGSPSATSATTAIAAAVGIDGGAGADQVGNHGQLEVDAAANADPDATADSDIASNQAASYAVSSAAAAGIASGEGSDTITNYATGRLLVTADAEAAPYAHSDENSTAAGHASASASGIETGEGDDTVSNLGGIDTSADATITATGVSRSLTIYAKSTAQADGNVEAAGIAAGGGNDQITNEASGTVWAGATANGSASATPRPNEGEHNEESTASVGTLQTPLFAEASAISGGDGADTIGNFGQLDAQATTAAAAYAKSNTDVATNKASAGATAGAIASGIDAGSGADTIRNEEGAGIEAMATTTVSAYADSDESSTAAGVASAMAVGIQAGDGDNAIANLGVIQATAQATLTAGTVAASHTDTAYSTALLTAAVQAEGIAAGQGTDAIANGEDSEITVSATATGTSAAVYDDTHLDQAAAAVGLLELPLSATATGIGAGNGNNTVENRGSIDVDALTQANAGAWADTDAARNWGTASATAAALASGIKAGSGSDTILNEQGAGIIATATATTTPADPAAVSAFARSDENATAAGNFRATARGIDGGDGHNTVTNLGGIEAIAGATTTATSIASSNSFTAYSTAGATASADAAGITTGRGNDLIANGEQGLVRTSATAGGAAVGTYFDEHMDVAIATALASATASGIDAGAGDNTVLNRGLIEVDALAGAYTVARASTSTADTHSSASSTAGAVAHGIRAAGGDNFIENYGVIDVRAEAQGSADAYSHTDWWGDEHTSMSVARTARAYGIQALDGSNTIINNGTILSTAVGSDTQAYGIQTGGGDDLIINNGTITTTRITNGVTSGGSPVDPASALDQGLAPGGPGGSSTEGVGIDTGAGNDQVVFGDGSFIGCTLDLGEGNDGLTVIGSGMITGNVFAGIGTDRITLDGATNFDLDQAFDFEALAKLGSSTVSLNNAQMLQQLDVWEGVLQINNGYQFTEDGSFSAKVYGGGDCGQLLVSGGLGLDGTMTVVRGPGAYLDGDTYEVLSADALSGSFDSIVLPGSTPLLAFRLEDSGINSYRVAASTEAFATVATNGIERSLTSCLDSIVASAEGDLSLVLGEIQALQPDGYRTAFSSLSPDSYACTTRTTFSAADQITQALSSRLRSLRPLSSSLSGIGDPRPLLQRTGYGTRAERNTTEERMADYGLWASGFSQWGGFAAGDGYTGFDFDLYGATLGYDRDLGCSLSAGASLGFANSQLYYDGSRGGGLVNSVSGSAYGSYAPGPLHMDTALSYGRQSCQNSRTVRVGEVLRTAASEHGSNALLAYLGGGLTLGRKPWALEPLACAQYVYLKEEGFTEQGAGSVSLSVQERTTHSLVSDLGLRLGLALDVGRRALATELFAAWRHDFIAEPGAITASFVDAPNTPFSIEGPENASNGVLLGASLLFRESGRFSAAVKYGLELRGGYRANSLSGEIQYGSSRAEGPR